MKTASKMWMPISASALVAAALTGCTLTGSGGTAGSGTSGGTAPTGSGMSGSGMPGTAVTTGTASGQQTSGAMSGGRSITGTTATTGSTTGSMSGGSSGSTMTATTTTTTNTSTNTSTNTAANTNTATTNTVAATNFGSTSTVFYPSGTEIGAALRVDRMCPPEVSANANFTYELKVTNVTRVALENVMLTETIPANFTLASSEPTGNVAGGAASFNLGSLAPGQTKSVRVTGMAGNAGSIASCATVTYTLPICCTITVVNPSLKIEKSMPPILESQCDTLPVRLVVSNPGTGIARNVMVSDPLPAGLMSVDGKQNVEFSAGDLAAGQSKTFEFQAKASKMGTFTNSATAKADGGLTANSNTVNVDVRNCNLVIAKRAEKAQLFQGRPATFTIEVRNTGNGVARNVMVNDAVPAGATFTSATEGGKLVGNAVQWSFGDMAPGASKTMAVTMNPGTSAVINNTATVRSVCCAEQSANASVAYDSAPAIVVELIDEPDPLLVGEETTYTIKVRNQGLKTDTNLRAVLTLANGLQFVSGAGASPVSAGGQVITFGTIASLAPKQEVIWTIRARSSAANGDTRQNLSVTTDFFKNPIVEIESTNLVQ